MNSKRLFEIADVLSFCVIVFVISSCGVESSSSGEGGNSSQTSNQAPQWTKSLYNTGLNVTDGTDADQIILDLNTVCSDSNNDTINYSIVSITVPSTQAEWGNSIVIENAVLLVRNLMTNDPSGNGLITVKVSASDSNGSNEADVSFNFFNVQ